MINRREIIRIPEFVLPRTTAKPSRIESYRPVRTRTLWEIWFDLPAFYKVLIERAAALVVGIVLGVGVLWLMM